MKPIIELIAALFALVILLITPKERVDEVANAAVKENNDKESIRDIIIDTEKIGDRYYAWNEGEFIGHADSASDLAKILLKKFGQNNLVFPPMKITEAKENYGIEKTIH